MQLSGSDSLALFAAVQLLRKVAGVQAQDHGQRSLVLLAVWLVLAGILSYISSKACTSRGSASDMCLVVLRCLDECNTVLWRAQVSKDADYPLAQQALCCMVIFCRTWSVVSIFAPASDH